MTQPQPAPNSEQTTTPSSSTEQVAGDRELTGKAWLLAGFNTGGNFIPLEPEHGTTAKIVFHTDKSIEGTTGINSFSGAWTSDKKTAAGYTLMHIAVQETSKNPAQNDIAANFDRQIIANLKQTQTVKYEKTSLTLMNEREEVLLYFIFRESDRL